MKLKQLFADEKAVSPVIGVILMVAITVILAAVIGTFVLGLGDQVQNTAPQASFTFDYDDGANELEATHDGGDQIMRADVSFSVSGGDGAATVSSDFPTTDVTAGDTATLTGVASTETVRVVWNSGQDNSATLGKWTGPDA